MKRILTGDLSDTPTQTKLLTLIARKSAAAEHTADDNDERKNPRKDKTKIIRREDKGRKCKAKALTRWLNNVFT
jgi:hypothetical protein